MSLIRLPFMLAGAVLLAACSSDKSGQPASTQGSPGGGAIRITGSDTMVNLVQAWAENYRKARPDVSVQVAGGGSGVGIAGLTDGILDIAASSREMGPDEIQRAKDRTGVEPREFAVAFDALAVYVHKDNPIDLVSIEELAEVYGDNGRIVKWSQLGVSNAACAGDEIIRVSRQNNSGTYVYFREAVLGNARDYRMGSIDQSGSKDVVALVSRTPCAIGYSGMAYATPDVKALKIAKKKGDPAVAPTAQTAIDKSYPIARPLYLYTRGEPTGQVKEFIDWTLGPDGQKVVQDIGYVPVPKPRT
jgi:phosphate transport system substrate-binding protein